MTFTLRAGEWRALDEAHRSPSPAQGLLRHFYCSTVARSCRSDCSTDGDGDQLSSLLSVTVAAPVKWAGWHLDLVEIHQASDYFNEFYVIIKLNENNTE